jgi:hypothetical protein
MMIDPREAGMAETAETTPQLERARSEAIN